MTTPDPVRPAPESLPNWVQVTITVPPANVDLDPGPYKQPRASRGRPGGTIVTFS